MTLKFLGKLTAYLLISAVLLAFVGAQSARAHQCVHHATPHSMAKMQGSPCHHSMDQDGDCCTAMLAQHCASAPVACAVNAHWESKGTTQLPKVVADIDTRLRDPHSFDLFRPPIAA
ncbi:hypothetical protein [Idiomarina tyrosinivorans]|uniref:hypothetical protein n=1 Tax=Idiomarina tyrosinivorans TaxID=1445662 RepID=UPI000F85BDA5|nr:hypothetical protein [Idiomarina tyrosinivorans]